MQRYERKSSNGPEPLQGETSICKDIEEKS